MFLGGLDVGNVLSEKEMRNAWSQSLTAKTPPFTFWLNQCHVTLPITFTKQPPFFFFLYW